MSTVRCTVASDAVIIQTHVSYIVFINGGLNFYGVNIENTFKTRNLRGAFGGPPSTKMLKYRKRAARSDCRPILGLLRVSIQYGLRHRLVSLK